MYSKLLDICLLFLFMYHGDCNNYTNNTLIPLSTNSIYSSNVSNMGETTPSPTIILTIQSINTTQIISTILQTIISTNINKDSNDTINNDNDNNFIIQNIFNYKSWLFYLFILILLIIIVIIVIIIYKYCFNKCLQKHITSLNAKESDNTSTNNGITIVNSSPMYNMKQRQSIIANSTDSDDIDPNSIDINKALGLDLMSTKSLDLVEYITTNTSINISKQESEMSNTTYDTYTTNTTNTTTNMGLYPLNKTKKNKQIIIVDDGSTFNKENKKNKLKFKNEFDIHTNSIANIQNPQNKTTTKTDDDDNDPIIKILTDYQQEIKISDIIGDNTQMISSEPNVHINVSNSNSDINKIEKRKSSLFSNGDNVNCLYDTDDINNITKGNSDIDDDIADDDNKQLKRMHKANNLSLVTNIFSEGKRQKSSIDIIDDEESTFTMRDDRLLSVYEPTNFAVFKIKNNNIKQKQKQIKKYQTLQYPFQQQQNISNLPTIVSAANSYASSTYIQDNNDDDEKLDIDIQHNNTKNAPYKATKGFQLPKARTKGQWL